MAGEAAIAAFLAAAAAAAAAPTTVAATSAVAPSVAFDTCFSTMMLELVACGVGVVGFACLFFAAVAATAFFLKH